MKKCFWIGLFTLLVYAPAMAQIDYAKKLAETIMKTYRDSMVVMKYASHLEQDNLIPPGQTAEQAQKTRPAVWNYEMGVVLIGFEKLAAETKDNRYLTYMKGIIDHFITADGGIRTFHMEEYNLDNIPTGRQLLHLYQQTREEKYRKAAETLYTQIVWQPRNKAGGLWHKLKYPTQMWLDGLYMAQPFAMEYAVMFGDTNRFDDMVTQFVLMEKYCRDSKTGLLYHGWDESRLQKWADPKTGRSPEFWSRAMGWYMMALVDVLDYLPGTHKGRPQLMVILNRLTTALVRYQDPKEGVWWQVTDKANKEQNYLESSSTAMFVYSMAKAIRKGYLNQSFQPALRKAYEGMVRNFVRTDADGAVHYIQAVAGAGLGGIPYRDGTYHYYVNEPRRDDDLKAIGPFLQACLEYASLNKK